MTAVVSSNLISLSGTSPGLSDSEAALDTVWPVFVQIISSDRGDGGGWYWSALASVSSVVGGMDQWSIMEHQ